MILRSILFACMTVAPQEGASKGIEIGKARIESSSKEGLILYSVDAKIVSLKDLLEAVSHKTGIRFEGLDSGAAQSMVSISLAERRLDEILLYVLGSVELGFVWENQTVRISKMPTADTHDGRLWLQTEGVKATYSAVSKYPAYPDSTRLNLAIARIDELEGRIEEANSRYQGIIRNFKGSPEEPEALLALGRNFLSMGQIEKARDFLTTLVNDYPRVPGTPEAWFLLGRSLIQLDSVEMAEDYLGAMTDNFADSPFTPIALIYLAEAKRRVGKAEQAQAMLQKIEKASLSEPRLREEFLLVYGRTLFDRGENKKAAATLCEFANAYPHRVEANPALFQASQACFRGNDYFSALLLCQYSEGKEGIDSVEWNKLALEIRAKLHLRQILDPNDPGAGALSAARSLRAVKKLDEAIETLERFFGDPDYGARTRVEAASCRLEKNDVEGCIQLLRGAIPICREEAVVNDAFRLLGDAYALQGKHDLAADAYRGIVRRDP